MNGATGTRSEIDLPTALGTVGEAMTATVVTVTPDMAAGEALGLLRRKGIGGAPAVRDGRVVGIVTVSDLAGPHPYPMQTGPFPRPGNGPAGWCVADLMTGSAVTAAADEPLAEAVLRMAQSRVDRLPVVDEDARPTGIVAREDVVRIIARTLRSRHASATPTHAYPAPD